MKKIRVLVALSCMLVSISTHPEQNALDVQRRTNIVIEAFNRGRVTLARILLLIQKNLYLAINTDLQGNSLLHIAALREDVVSAIDLVNNGFDPNMTNNQGKTALDIFTDLVESVILGDETLLNARISRLEQYQAMIDTLPPVV